MGIFFGVILVDAPGIKRLYKSHLRCNVISDGNGDFICASDAYSNERKGSNWTVRRTRCLAFYYSVRHNVASGIEFGIEGRKD